MQNQNSHENTNKSADSAYAREQLAEARAQEALLRGEPAPKKPAKKKKSSNTALKVIFGVIALIGLGFFGVMGFNTFTEKQEIKKNIEIEQQHEREKLEAIKAADNPFTVLTGTTPPPPADPASARVEGGQVIAGTSTFVVNGSTLVGTHNGCTVEAVTDLCLSAHGQLNSTKFEVFFLKDISRNRFLENPNEFKEFKKDGDTIAATMSLDIAGVESPVKVGALTANKNDGFVIVFSDGTTSEQVEEVMTASSVL